MAATFSPEYPASTMAHVPSWKRLGLKLKYANDTNEQPARLAESRIDTTRSAAKFDINAKRRRDYGQSEDEHSRLLKKGKCFVEPPTELAFGDVSGDRNHSVSERCTEQHINLTVDVIDEQPDRTTSETRRKSVTFTPDTKTDDGFSAQDLFKAWASSEDRRHEHVAPAEASSPSIARDSKVSKAQRKRQRAASITATESRQLLLKDSSTVESYPEYLAYLIRFHNDKSTWKFNKSKQTALLKNIFNINCIPSAYNDALIAYISGLQGGGAQQRLLREAEDILQSLLQSQYSDSEIKGMYSLQARRVAYQNALQREIEKVERSCGGRSEYNAQQLEDMKRDIERGKRAEAVLAELLQRKLAPDSPSAAPTVNSQPARGNPSLESVKTSGTRQKTAKRRKRKARTEILSSDESRESSSSSSSSSESESE